MSDTSLPHAMGNTPLPTLPSPEPDAIRLIQAMLDQRPLPADLQARLADTAAMAERREREAVQRLNDWPALARYRAANAAVRNPDVVMIGDSITEIWQIAMPEMFGGAIVNRGIAGQTSPQILLRFMADVVDLRPRRVHILCGTNDIAGNTGPTVPEDYQRNVRAMADLAMRNGIEPLLASIPPASAIFWQPDARPLEWIPHLNDWLRTFCATRSLRYVDYHAALTDGAGALQERFSADGVHVTRSAYRVMARLLAEACADGSASARPAGSGSPSTG
ncbi:GDSL-type esterase/lipase family protein [Sphingomonas oryzagri]|uniref:GDSL-type esterase/lipase family protein n=1 Tax=Sphingomonas oryzagri TaxID=3042314 RepID=A0ABT6N1F8_9SPHN|nr:GDSL-type esterase/lipase family protein [Sphingomonas oryzagri]MDH7639095.1 GDSL-type esterase/lipase family protein [Sphingomonas oryzagri]